MNNYNWDNQFTMNQMRSAWKRAHGDKYWQYFEPFLKQMFEPHIRGTFKDTAEEVMETHKDTFQRLASDDSGAKKPREWWAVPTWGELLNSKAAAEEYASGYDNSRSDEVVLVREVVTPDDEGGK